MSSREPFRTLSERQNPNATVVWDEGVPERLLPGLYQWIARLGSRVNRGHLYAVVPSAAGVWDEPDDWRRFPHRALDVFDYILAHVATAQEAAALDRLLLDGRSAWKVVSHTMSLLAANPGLQSQPAEGGLERREIGDVDAVLTESLSTAGTAHEYLVKARHDLFRRDPDPTASYAESMKAVEGIAAPLFTPKASKPTLGMIAAAIRDAPGKWTSHVPGIDMAHLASILSQTWAVQDRHGSTGENPVVRVTFDEALAAFHVALMVAAMIHHDLIQHAAT